MSVSVIIPAYNAERYLEECLGSIKRQTWLPDEVILVDDGSTDATFRIAKDSGICRIIRHFENRGIGFSRQHGVEEAVCDYIAFLSADDMWQPNFLATVLPRVQPNHIVFSDYYRCNENMIVQSVFKAPFYETQEQFKQLVIEWALQKNMFTMFSTVLIPRSIFKTVKFRQDLRHGEDLIFLLETVIANIPWSHTPQPLVNYRVHKQSGTKKAKNEIEWQQLWETQTPLLRTLGVNHESIIIAMMRNRNVVFPSLTSRMKNKAKRLLVRSSVWFDGIKDMLEK